YAFAKRQRELAKKQKKEEKLKRKAEQSETSGAPGEEEAQAGESAERTPPDDQSAAGLRSGRGLVAGVPGARAGPTVRAPGSRSRRSWRSRTARCGSRPASRRTPQMG